MLDQCGRTIDYLRLSVTDLCNYRCQYCMPADGVAKRPHTEILSLEELVEISEACIACGVRKIRLTGGEPLVRRGIVDLCRKLRQLPGLEELCITTNASLLPQLAQPLRKFVDSDFAGEFLSEALLTWSMAGKSFDEIYGMMEKHF